MEELYKNIRRRRVELGLSQEQLAEMTGYTSRTSIAKIESGKVNLPADKIVLFAGALNIPYSELTGWAGGAEGRPEGGVPLLTQQALTCGEVVRRIEDGAFRPDELVQIISAASACLSAMTKTFL